MYPDDAEMVNPVKPLGLTTEHSAAVIVIGSLLALILIRRGFRGVSAGGVGINIR
jgi:hypothetical protein